MSDATERMKVCDFHLVWALSRPSGSFPNFVVLEAVTAGTGTCTSPEFEQSTSVGER